MKDASTILKACTIIYIYVIIVLHYGGLQDHSSCGQDKEMSLVVVTRQVPQYYSIVASYKN